MTFAQRRKVGFRHILEVAEAVLNTNLVNGLEPLVADNGDDVVNSVARQAGDSRRRSVDLLAAIKDMLPKVEQKDLQAVYRLVKTLTQQ